MTSIATASAFLCGAFSCANLRQRLADQRKRLLLRERAMAGASQQTFFCKGLSARVLSFARDNFLNRQSLKLPVPGAQQSIAMAKTAGFEADLGQEHLAYTQWILALLGAAAGALLGALLSNALALLLGLASAVWGFHLLPRALREESKLRAQHLERHLSEALEVLCLALRSGLSFDRSLTLYCSLYQGLLAQDLLKARNFWTCGFDSLEGSLKRMAATYDSDIFRRVIDSICRSLKFGTPLAQNLFDLARDSREAHKSAVKERVMKAPVKMMVPIGTLILPSMLMLVLGPVLLELL